MNMLMPNDALLAPRKTILVTAVMFASLAPLCGAVQTGPDQTPGLPKRLIDIGVRWDSLRKWLNNNLNAMRPTLIRIKVISPEVQCHKSQTVCGGTIMSDSQLRQDIIEELEFDPSLSGEHIGVAVDKGVVTLGGHVNSYAEKLAAIAAARRVKGVHAIAENIEVHRPYEKKTADDEIAKRTYDILKWDVFVPPNAIDVLVHEGWVTLSGNVNWHFEKTSAEDDVRKLSGVRGITNMIAIKPHIDAANVKSKIDSALKRHAEVEANAISVSVQNGNKVVLEGDVGTWGERRAVEDAAWSAPGVASVENRLTMTGDAHRYSLPGQLEPDLNRIQAYWNALKRGANDVPFWDDVKLSLRSRLGRESMLIGVFENPLRFRFDLIGADVANWYGGTIGNSFLDEIDLHAPFDELTLQCKAAVEGCAPTYYCQTAFGKADAEHPGGYARLLLPLWGNGRIEMLLGAVVLDATARRNSG
jgi:hyperosmotically inducible protein